MNPPDLLLQASELASREFGQVSDTDLRRSVSSCYYALFHAISDDAAAVVASIFNPRLRSAVRRTITHEQMKKACVALGAVQSAAGSSLRSFFADPIEVELVEAALLLIELQQLRNSADYDSLAVFSQNEVLACHRRTKRAYDHWLAVREAPNAVVFLTAVLLGDRLGKRG